jgi:hypothetical protein
MISHENYEKRSLNMEFNYTSDNTLFNIALALKDERVKQVVNTRTLSGLTFIKDYLPDGTPCWRLPTQEEINEFNKEKTKDEI